MQTKSETYNHAKIKEFKSCTILHKIRPLKSAKNQTLIKKKLSDIVHLHANQVEIKTEKKMIVDLQAFLIPPHKTRKTQKGLRLC